MEPPDPRFSLLTRLSVDVAGERTSRGGVFLPPRSRLTTSEIRATRLRGDTEKALLALEDELFGEDEAEQGDGPVVFLAPYLPLTRTVRMGPWELIPFDEWSFDRATAPEIGLEVRRAAQAYDPAVDEYAFGAIIVPAERRVGEWVDPRLERPLSRALLAATLDRLPLLDGHDTWCFDCRRQVLTTAENAIVIAYPLHGGQVHHTTGAIVRSTVTQLRQNYEPLNYRIPPPEDLLLPPHGEDLDGVYAGNLYTLLEQHNSLGRRLDVVIGWLQTAASNATAMIAEVRVLSFRSAFEVLLEAGAQTTALRRSLRVLLEPHAVPHRRDWREHGRSREAELTDVEWWFQKFALLRNAIAHGGPLEPEMWKWQGVSHLDVAQEVLVRAIRRTVESEIVGSDASA